MHDNFYDFVCAELEELDKKAKSGNVSLTDVQYADLLEHYKRYSSEGYSRAADDVVERMRDLMQDAPDEQTRQEIQRLVSRMESMM